MPNIGGTNGLQCRPHDIYRPTLEELRERGTRGGRASGAAKAKRVTEVAVQDVRRMLLDVRSSYTPQQFADMERVVRIVYARGVQRGYQRGYTSGHRAGRRKATA